MNRDWPRIPNRGCGATVAPRRPGPVTAASCSRHAAPWVEEGEGWGETRGRDGGGRGGGKRSHGGEEGREGEGRRVEERMGAGLRSWISACAPPRIGLLMGLFGWNVKVKAHLHLGQM